MTAALYPLFTALAFGAIGTFGVRAVARHLNLVVAPRADRWHARPTAMYGGVAIGLAVASALVLAAADVFTTPAALAVLGAAGILFCVGLVDDARGMGPIGKFILQLAAGTVLILSGVVYPLTPWNPVNVLVTLFWFVGIVNALNLLDNMDGVTAGVAAIAALGFAILFGIAGDPVFVALALATAGAAIGFLIFNFKPASIFMGDVGSLFLGGMLAGLGVAYPRAEGVYGTAALLVPGLILLVPVLDTALVTVTRTLHNRRISAGGRDHSTHRLVAMGLSEAKAALFLYAFGIVAFGVAMVAGWLPATSGLWFGLVFLTGALVFTGYLGTLYRYDDGRPAEERRRGLIFRNILLKRRGLELLLDVGLFGVAYYGAFVIHFDGAIPRELGPVVNGTLGLAIVLKLAAFHYFSVYRGVWDRAGLADVHRIIKASLLAGFLVVGASFVMGTVGNIPTGVFIVDTLLTGTLALAARSSFRSLDRFRKRISQDDGETILICGTGPAADLVVAALPHTGRSVRVLGFVDDRGHDSGTLLHGHPVIGPMRSLQQFLAVYRPDGVVIVPDIADAGARDWVLSCCRSAGVDVYRMHLELRRRVISSNVEENGRSARDSGLAIGVEAGGGVDPVRLR
jgi:UDP-GlcNAc:undecaprenyl-phosphate/decaprenyl-phosphate GlcNAc-1-phosphate transferase